MFLIPLLILDALKLPTVANGDNMAASLYGSTLACSCSKYGVFIADGCQAQKGLIWWSNALIWKR